MEDKILSQRGHRKFAHNGYLYIFDKVSKQDGDLKFWHCEQLGKCKGRIHTKNGEVNFHHHDPSAVDVKVAEIITNVKLRAEETNEQPSSVINEVLTHASQAAQGAAPNASAMKKIIYRKRKEIRAPPPNPINLHELVLPHEFSIYVPHTYGRR